MKRTSGRRLFPIPILFVALPLLLVSCSSWQRIRALSEPAARDKHYTQLAVDLVGGGVLVLRDSWFGGDTLYGLWVRGTLNPTLGSTVKYERGDSVAVPIERIAKLEAWRFNGAKTALLAVRVGWLPAL